MDDFSDNLRREARPPQREGERAMATRYFKTLWIFGAALLICSSAIAGAGLRLGLDYRDGFSAGAVFSSSTRMYEAKDVLTYPLEGGVLEPGAGTLALRLKKIAPANANKGATEFDNLFSLIDGQGRHVLAVYAVWGEKGKNPAEPGINIYSETLPGKPWGFWIPLPTTPKNDEVFEIALSWGPGGNKVYFNGTSLQGAYDDFLKTRTASAAGGTAGLASAVTLRIGSDAYERDNSPLDAAQLLSFKVYDAEYTAVLNDTTPPEPVARVLAEPGFGGEIKVSWTPSASSDADHYEIYRGLGKAPATTGTPYQVTAKFEHNDTGLVAGSNYFYRIVTVDQSGNRSAASESAGATAPAGEGPRIASVVVEPSGKPLRPGDTLKVIVQGAPGGKGLADIQGLLADLVLTEVKGTGRYEGTLPITPAEVANERQTLQVVGKLADAYGASQQAGPVITIVSVADLNDRTAPKIDGLTHDGFAQTGFSGKLVAGDTLTVTLNGEAAGSANFRLVGVTEPQPMAEVAPGLYKGSYTLGFEDEGERVAVEATLADFAGNPVTAVAAKTVDLDTRVRLVVTAKDTLLPADRASKTRVTVRAEDANGDDVEGHELALTLSTTSEYTGVVGGGKMEDKFAAKDDVDDIEVKWSGVTDSFGEIAATYTAGFAAKTALIVAKDMTTGDMGAGWVNTYVASTVAIELIPRAARDAADLAQMTMSITPAWLTADGRSKARVKVWLTDFNNAPIAGAVVNFIQGGSNGSLKVLRGVTDEKGLAEAEYRAGTLAGFETITAQAPAYNVVRSMQVELRSDAPAKIDLTASAVTLPADGRSTSNITAVVSDINDNRNPNVPVMFKVLEGAGTVAPAQANTNLTGVVEATYTAGTAPGVSVVEARHTSRVPSAEELRRIAGTVFVPRLYKGQESDRIKVAAWLVKEGDEVAKGQPLVELETSEGKWTIPAAEKGILVRYVRHKRDRVETGETLGYVEIDPEVWEAKYAQ
jgi:biotin carboxyl carrier protein